MAHHQQLRFVEKVASIFPEYFNKGKVLEVGSWSLYGSVRNNFKNVEYTGADVLPGAGVDVVCGGQNLKFPDNNFDMCISCECFEHNPFWVETFLNMIRMLRPGGMCIITCATIGRREHGTKRSLPEASLTTELTDTDDYYMNLTKTDFLKKVDFNTHFSDYRFYKNIYSKDLSLVAFKSGGTIPSDIGNRFQNLKREAASITTVKGANFPRKVVGHVANGINEIIIPLVGDHNYRSLQHKFRQFKSRLKSKTV